MLFDHGPRRISKMMSASNDEKMRCVHDMPCVHNMPCQETLKLTRMKKCDRHEHIPHLTSRTTHTHTTYNHTPHSALEMLTKTSNTPHTITTQPHIQHTFFISIDTIVRDFYHKTQDNQSINDKQCQCQCQCPQKNSQSINVNVKQCLCRRCQCYTTTTRPEP